MLGIKFNFNFSNKKNSFVRKSKISGSLTDDIYENNNERLTSVTRNFQLIQSIDLLRIFCAHNGVDVQMFHFLRHSR